MAAYVVAAGVVLLSGVLYPDVRQWSYWAAGLLGAHGLLSLIVLAARMADAGRIAAWCWHAISALLCVGLLLVHDRTQQGGWLLAMAVVGGFTLIVTLVFMMGMKPDSVSGR